MGMFHWRKYILGEISLLHYIKAYPFLCGGHYHTNVKLCISHSNLPALHSVDLYKSLTISKSVKDFEHRLVKIANHSSWKRRSQLIATYDVLLIPLNISNLLKDRRYQFFTLQTKWICKRALFLLQITPRVEKKNPHLFTSRQTGNKTLQKHESDRN